MHESAPIPPDPESERRGHELRDVALKPIIIFLIGLFLFGGTVEFAMKLLMDGYVAQESKTAIPKTEMFYDAGNLDHPAPLQQDTTADMLQMYKDDHEVLSSFGHDKKTGRYHIPIDRAMKVVARKGLPHRDTPKSAIDPDLPYPRHSQPYMATP